MCESLSRNAGNAPRGARDTERPVQVDATAFRANIAPMRISVEIPDDQLAELTRIAKREGVSRAALLRKAIADLLAAQRRDAIADAFGLRPDMEDGLGYQERLRGEW